ncbi:MAG TPA: hypothetical protein VHK66_06885 [Microvirga sp.]|jgi:hypothetical protein|nr:hypothetical protein [Microvirga sp.]
MFSTLRIAAVVGVIYYLSPVRHEDAKAGVEHVVAWGKGLVAPSREASSAERVEALWKALPDDAKQAAIDRMLSEAGKQLQSRSGDLARPEGAQAAARSVEAGKPGDFARPDGIHPAPRPPEAKRPSDPARPEGPAHRPAEAKRPKP